MKKALTILFMTMILGASGPARADDDHCTVPMADWQPREAVVAIAKEQGLTVQRIRIDDGCYQIKGRDASGREVEIKLEPDSLRVIDVEYDD